MLSTDTEGRCLVAIDVDVELRILGLQIAGHVQQLRQRGHLFLQRVGIRVELVTIRALQRQLIRALGDLPADLNQWRVLQKDSHPGHGRESGPQVFDDCVNVLFSLVDRFEQNQDVAGVAGRANVAEPNG